MQLLTLKDAARRLGLCEQVTRRILVDHKVLVGTRFRYPLDSVERVAERGTALSRPQAPYFTSQQVAP
jgi:hypothetical protein